MKINPNDTQTLTFENTKAGGLIVKKMDSISRKPLAGVEFKITYTDGRFVDMDGGKVSTKGMFALHLEKQPNRFQRMALTHPKQHNFCINKLGCGQALDYIGVPYMP